MNQVPPPEKPHLILLPGLPGTGSFFDLLVPELGENFDIDAVSYPQDKPLGYQQLLELVTSRIPKEKPYFILGESFSGPLAVMAASLNPENLRGVILTATFVTSPMPRIINGLKPLVDTPLLELRSTWMTNERLMGKNCEEKTRIWIHKTMPRLDRKVLAARIIAVLGVNVREQLKNLKVPILYIAGARDWLVGRKCIDTIWLCRPDVQIKVVDGVHMILQTNAHDSAEEIKSFCNRVMGSPRSKVQDS